MHFVILDGVVDTSKILKYFACLHCFKRAFFSYFFFFSKNANKSLFFYIHIKFFFFINFKMQKFRPLLANWPFLHLGLPQHPVQGWTSGYLEKTKVTRMTLTRLTSAMVMAMMSFDEFRRFLHGRLQGDWSARG